MPLLGVDTGGTFTDFVLLAGTGEAGQNIQVHKVLSTPDAPEQAILQGIHELGLSDADDLIVVHGSTVATNAVLEGKGVRTAFITNYGFRDLLTIGRQARRELYNLNPPIEKKPVPRELCLETGGRIAADGEVLESLTEEELSLLRSELEKLAPEAVAINLIFSWLDDQFERCIEKIVPKNIFVSRSSKVMPEYREYERGITTWLNASVGPLVEGYLQRFSSCLPLAKISVMQSSGGTIDSKQAGEQAVNMLLSGPAGGLAGVQYIGQLAGEYRLLSFDMGGTSTDVALLDAGNNGAIELTTEGRIGPYPVGVPMVDMHTIGAGGGSIARVDAGGLLHVGPESAGADPGPACYGRGGKEPTVSDANLVLGRLRSDSFLGGNMSLDEAAARKAIAKVANPLGMTEEDAAQGIIDVANEHMARALRVMSVQRGIDPAGLTLASFGGAGGLHVCALAESLGMRKALIPVHAGVLSALGMLVAPRVRHLSHTMNRLMSEVDNATLQQEIDILASQGQSALIQEAIAVEDIKLIPSVDVRYRGQSYAINLQWQGVNKTTEAFHARHETLYGHRINQDVELVTLRVKTQGPRPQISLVQKSRPHSEFQIKTSAPVNNNALVPVYPRDKLTEAKKILGPALIIETVSTTYIAPGWQCVPDNYGNLILTIIDEIESLMK